MPVVDYLIATPLDEEWQSCSDVLGPFEQNQRSEEHGETITYYLQKHAREYLLVGASMGAMGHSEAALFARDALFRWRPSGILLVGIAGGFEPEVQQLGDVVVASEVFGYELSSVDGPLQQERFRPSGHQVGHLLTDRFRALRSNRATFQAWQDDCIASAAGAQLHGQNAIARPPEIHLRPIASGNEVVRSRARADKLRAEIHPQIAAVEMEAKGLFTAVHRAPYPVSVAMVRGLSDLADEHKQKLDNTASGIWRSYAAGNAARLVKHVLGALPTKPLSAEYMLHLENKHDAVAQLHMLGLGLPATAGQFLHFRAALTRMTATPSLRMRIVSNPTQAPLRAVVVRRGGGGKLEQFHPSTGGDGIEIYVPATENACELDILLTFATPATELSITASDEFGRTVSGTWR